MLKANVEPKECEGEIAYQLWAEVSYYDLGAGGCKLRYKLINENGGAYFVDFWYVEPESVLQNWGTDDTTLIQTLADYKGLTITSFTE